ncbi:MAG: restriction endonuclease subunit S, partial [Chloroflexota bacterium]
MRESVPVVSGEQYRLLGVSGKAKGVFSKAAVDSRTTRATRLYRVKSGQFIYNRLFASTGSFAIVPPELGDSYVSNEFPSFDTDTTRLDAGYLYLTFQQPAVWDRVASECVGSTGSRFRWSEARFAQFEISLPPLAEQRRIVDLFDAVDAAIDAARQQQGAVAEARKALLAEVMQPRESWAETTLGSVGDSWGGGTPSKAEPSYWNGKVPWASPKDFGKPFIPDSKDHI